MNVKLVQVGEYGNQEFNFSGKEIIIGREMTCDLRPEHGRVSHRHTRLFWKGGRLMADDLNSTLGTYLNGQRLDDQPVELEDGDELRVGPVHYLVMIASSAAEMAERTEDWMSSALQSRLPPSTNDSTADELQPMSAAAKTARAILDRISTAHEGGGEHHHRGQHRRSGTGGRRHGLEVTEESGVALAKILDRSVIDDAEIGRIARELEALIDSGQNRIALHFGNVEHLSSQALSTVIQAHKRCKASGGILKICTVRPQVAQIFAMTNIQQHIEVYADALPALESVWPHPVSSRASDIATSGTTTPAVDLPEAQPTPITPSEATPTPVLTSLLRVRLVVEVGRAKGQAIEVRTPRFVIGRDRRCQLRPNSESISRVHAIIELRDGKVFVRDYGTKNGTVLNDRILRGEEAEVNHGDRLQVGVLQFSFQIEPDAEPASGAVEDDLAAWLLGQDKTDADASTALLIPTTGSAPTPSPESSAPDSTPAASEPTNPTGPGIGTGPPPASPTHLYYEVYEGVLVVMVPNLDLDDETTVGPLRHDLYTLFEHQLPRRVVLDLGRVMHLSSRAVGVVLAFFQRLDRDGGALRLCNVHPRVLPVLEQMRLPRLVDIFPNTEEAVKTPWI